MTTKIPFNKAHRTGKETGYIQKAFKRLHLAADGVFSRKCQRWLEKNTRSPKALLMHSGTHALELCAILAEIGPGDEVIMPSYTFVSTANAFVLRGGVPVFVDIRPGTLNLDESKIEAAISAKTRAIVAVHYAGVACEMDAIMAIAKKHHLLVIEDAAQGILSTYRGRPLGSIGHMAAISFHETKNITSGEGGAILLNDKRFFDRADIVSQKGTNRKRFLSGQVDKYTWEDLGSSFLPSELTAAFLWAQMEEAKKINKKRMKIWNQYHTLLSQSPFSSEYTLPTVPKECGFNAHLYYLLAHDLAERNKLIAFLKAKGIQAVFHYAPLHESRGGERYGRVLANLSVTEDLARRLVRLPLWTGLTGKEIQRVCEAVWAFYRENSRPGKKEEIR